MATVTITDQDVNFVDPAFEAFGLDDDIIIQQGATLRITTPTAAVAHIDNITCYSKLVVDGRGWKSIAVSGATGAIAQGDVITVRRGTEIIGTGIYYEDVAGALGVRELTVTLQAGDTLSTQGGYNATADGDATVRFMEVLIDSFATRTSTDIEMLGDWFQVGVSTGLPSQTMQYPSVGHLSVLRTGDGSPDDPFVYWHNILTCPFSEFTVPEVSFVFQKDFGSNEIRFGDGTNGNLPPEGCVFYAHNTALFAHTAGAHKNDTVSYTFDSVKRLILDTVAFGRYVEVTGLYGLDDDSRFADSGFCRFIISRNRQTLVFRRCAWSNSNLTANQTLLTMSSCQAPIVLDHCSILSPQTNVSLRAVSAGDGNQFEAYDTKIILGHRPNGFFGFALPDQGSVVAHRCTLVGSFRGSNVDGGVGVQLVDCRWGPTPGPPNPIQAYTLEMQSRFQVIRLQYIDGAGGSTAASKLSLLDTDYVQANILSYMTHSGTREVPLAKDHGGIDKLFPTFMVARVVLFDCHWDIENTGSDLMTARAPLQLTMWNCSNTVNHRIPINSNMDIRSYKGMANTVGESDFRFDLVYYTARNAIFATTFPADSDTDGMLRLFAVSQSPGFGAYEVIQGNPDFRRLTLYMWLGDIVEWTWSYSALGFLGFSGEPIIRRTGTTDTTGITWTFDVGTNGTFLGNYLPLDLTNLQSVSVDWTAGIQLRIRAECTAASESFQQLGIPMLTSAASQIIEYEDPTTVVDIWRTIEWIVSAVPNNEQKFTATVMRDEGPYLLRVYVRDIPATVEIDGANLLFEDKNTVDEEEAHPMTRVGEQTFEFTTAINQFNEYPPGTVLNVQIELIYRGARNLRGRGRPFAEFTVGSNLRDDQVINNIRT